MLKSMNWNIAIFSYAEAAQGIFMLEAKTEIVFSFVHTETSQYFTSFNTFDETAFSKPADQSRLTSNIRPHRSS